MFLSSIVFVIALSIDGFGVGLAYGLRKICIPGKSLLIISVSSALVLALSMWAGQFLASFLSVQIAGFLGGLALILVGAWLLLQAWSQGLLPEDALNLGDSEDIIIFKLNISCLGLVIKILKEPARADFDASGVISINEAFFLGFALALDALAAGFGAAMMGFNPWLTPLVLALTQFSLVFIGLYLGQNLFSVELAKGLGFMPGMIIIILGLLQLGGLLC